jgi:hypothetical protein
MLALVGIDEELVEETFFVSARIAVDAIERAYRYAGGVHAIAAQPRNDPRQGFPFLRVV